MRVLRSNWHGGLALVIGVLGLIAGAVDPARAHPITNRVDYRGTDFTSAGVGGLRNSGSGTIKLQGVTGVVTQAWLFWAGPTATTNANAYADLTVSNGSRGAQIRGALIGISSDNCWGFTNSLGYRADVTGLVRGNGDYLLSGPASQEGSNNTTNLNGASLLVFYDDGDPGNDRDIVCFYGNDSNARNPHDGAGWMVDLPGVHYTTGQACIELHVSDGQHGRNYLDGTNLVNGEAVWPDGNAFSGTSVPSMNNGPLNNGNLWDIVKLDVTDSLRRTKALRLENRPPAGLQPFDCVSLIVAVWNLPAGAAPTNRPPVILADAVVTNEGCGPIVLRARVTDLDGDALTTAASVDGTLVSTGLIPQGSPTTSGTISFTNTFAVGEHRIVFAAADGFQSASVEMGLRVIDTTPPVLKLPADLTQSPEPGGSNALITFAATATDNCDPEVIVLCEPPSGSLFPVDVTVVRCSATDRAGNTAQGTFTVTIQPSQDSPRLLKRQGLASLEQLLPTITDRDQRHELREAVNHLARSLTPAWWVDDLHLVRRTGEKIFHEEEEATDDLREAIREGLPAALVQGTINSMVAADRALAATAIDEADRPTCKKDYLAKARRYFAAGDARAAANRPSQAIEQYEKAWKYAVSAN